MTFSDFPELSTGLTDLANGILAAVLLVLMRKFSSEAKPWKWLMWSFLVSGVLGGYYHTIYHTFEQKEIIWVFVALPMALSIALFVVCTLTVVHPDNLKFALRMNLPLCLVVYIVMMIAHFISDSSLAVYTVYAVVFVLCSLAMLINQMIKRKSKAILFYVLAIAFQIPGGIIQARGKMLIGVFNHSSIYHFALTASMILIYFGVKLSEKTSKTSEINEKSA